MPKRIPHTDLEVITGTKTTQDYLEIQVGHSGSTRSKYTMKAFGEDVQAVTEATNSHSVILIGHSMGGSVIAEAARLMPKRIIRIVGVDTLDNIEYPMTREAFDRMIAPLKSDFQAGSRQFVKEMISSQTHPLIREWILSDKR
jgi:pimeloyl-ACP methyl ester carboxylesterase